MILGQGRAQRGDRIRHPGLRQRDGVHVALDHEDFAPVVGDLPREVVGVEQLSLVEDRGIGGVEVLGLTLPQNPATEGDGVPLPIPDREHQPTPEHVVRGAAVVRRLGQCRFDQHPGVKALRHQLAEQPVARVRRVAQLEPLHGFRRQPPLFDVGAGLGALGRKQRLLIGTDRRLHRLFQALGALGLARGIRVGLGHVQPGLRRQRLDRIEEGLAVVVHDEADVVAVLTAAKAVVKALLVVDVERGCLFVVEGAAGGPFAPFALQLDPRANHVRQVEPVADFIKKSGGDRRHGPALCPSSFPGKAAFSGCRPAALRCCPADSSLARRRGQTLVFPGALVPHPTQGF